MATEEEIERRVQQADTARSAKRSAAAKQVGVLAQRRTAIAEQLDDIERQLGEVLADSSDVIDIDELARFTDVPAADLTRWLAARKPSRSKRKKPGTGVSSDANRGPSTTKTSTTGQAAAAPETAVPRTDAHAADTPARVPAGVS
ncbi:hypothetical protein KIPE111705_23305 [Kibdelosporangium persicum]|uniref:hypothetical protein n=1 Tax=Kibdelosporangium persicum TaxID=2698649 RepID=UPI001563846B|nr:hypothetical protein [Kibdelosporangium persicum]